VAGPAVSGVEDTVLHAPTSVNYPGVSVPPCPECVSTGEVDTPGVFAAFLGSVNLTDFSDFAGSGSSDFVFVLFPGINQTVDASGRHCDGNNPYFGSRALPLASRASVTLAVAERSAPDPSIRRVACALTLCGRRISQAWQAGGVLYQRSRGLTDVGPVTHSDGCDPFGLGDELSPCVAGRVYDGVVVLEDGV
jgi:hypothetical protein